MNQKENHKRHIVPLNMNGLAGRMLKLPASGKSSRNILLIYGHHASIERMMGLAEALSDFGTVTVPDLPGFGGMDSLYRLGSQPTLDELANYLAAFVKMEFRHKRFVLVGMSLGFAIATRMLQLFPELVGRVDLLVSIGGFAHKDDFRIARRRALFYRAGARFFSFRIPATFFYNVVLHPSIIRAIYSKTYNAKYKFEGLNAAQTKRAIEFEVILWRKNDVRTHMKNALLFFSIDNCGQRVNLPVCHVAVKNDHYLDHAIVEQHMRVIFTDCITVYADSDRHSPSIIADRSGGLAFLPTELRNMLKEGS